ncbi:FecR domain-containing protein [Caulobacter sp. 1776]|uniref:FecR family protein n=1 Tax=Caulobacter sp. 1776 TaxID=3156420 RepID=UPI003395CE3F
MTSSRTPPSGMSVEDDAAWWLARHDADPSTAADPAFLAWLAQSERHAQVWARAQAVWRRAGQDLKDDPLAEALRVSALAVRPPVWPKALAAASIAVVVLLGAAGGWRYWTGREHSEVIASDALPSFTTGVGERRAVTLSDGTRLDLDSDTRVEVAFDDKARRLTLVKGRTYIQVRRDPKRPFAVDAGDQTIVDRGTAFGVRLSPDVVAVMLVQGSVAVGARGAAPDHELRPGQRLVLQAGRPARIERFDPNIALAWREGFVEFSDTPLSEAVAEMNRYGGRRMVITDPRIGDLKISGRFELGDPDRFLRTVAMLLPVRAVRVDDTLEIRPAT